MDAQDFRSLQAAYLGVYIQEEVDIKLNEGWKFGTGEPAPNSKVKNNS